MGISIQAIRSSFALVKPVAQDVAEHFYQNLFEDFPESKVLFAAADMQKHKNDLIGTLVEVVDNLDKPDALTHFLLELGERHVRYGVKDIHYKWVGATLFKTLGEFLGAHWNDYLCDQWARIYDILVDAMRVGSNKATKPVPGLHAVQQDKQEKEINMNKEKKSASDLTSDLSSSLALPQDLCAQIQKSVKATVVALVKAEVNRHFAQELQRLENLSPEDLVRLAG